MERRFSTLCLRLGVHPERIRMAWIRLAAHYSEAHRHYHDLSHLEALLPWLDSSAPGDDAMELAIWFHDVIYDPMAHDNEEASARFFEGCFETELDAELSGRVVRLIMATKHSTPRTGLADEDLIRDIDLTILAAVPATYDSYRRAIRREYSHVPDADYILGRGKVLTHFLENPVFVTPRFLELEDPARQNILTELRGLEA